RDDAREASPRGRRDRRRRVPDAPAAGGLVVPDLDRTRRAGGRHARRPVLERELAVRFLTAGESHGPGLTVIVDGVPAGIALDGAAIDADLRRRQLGYGRGARQRIEHDSARITGGVRQGRTTGAPVALWIENRDAVTW